MTMEELDAMIFSGEPMKRDSLISGDNYSESMTIDSEKVAKQRTNLNVKAFMWWACHLYHESVKQLYSS